MTAQNGVVQQLLRLHKGQVSTNGISRGNHAGLDLGNLQIRSQIHSSASSESYAQTREQARVFFFMPTSNYLNTMEAEKQPVATSLNVTMWGSMPESRLFPLRLFVSFM